VYPTNNGYFFITYQHDGASFCIIINEAVGVVEGDGDVTLLVPESRVDMWNHFRVEMDIVNKNYDIYLNDDLIGTGFGNTEIIYRNNEAITLTSLFRTSNAYFDNISVVDPNLVVFNPPIGEQKSNAWIYIFLVLSVALAIRFIMNKMMINIR
jgi:hypothetical protein